MKKSPSPKILSVLFVLLLSACSSATDTSRNSNLDYKHPSDPAAGGFSWGENDPKTGKHKPEASDLEVIKRQDEVIKRQETELERIEREKQDILRQKYYNEKQKALQQ